MWFRLHRTRWVSGGVGKCSRHIHALMPAASSVSPGPISLALVRDRRVLSRHEAYGSGCGVVLASAWGMSVVGRGPHWAMACQWCMRSSHSGKRVVVASTNCSLHRGRFRACALVGSSFRQYQMTAGSQYSDWYRAVLRKSRPGIPRSHRRGDACGGDVGWTAWAVGSFVGRDAASISASLVWIYCSRKAISSLVSSPAAGFIRGGLGLAWSHTSSMPALVSAFRRAACSMELRPSGVVELIDHTVWQTGVLGGLNAL